MDVGFATRRDVLACKGNLAILRGNYLEAEHLFSDALESAEQFSRITGHGHDQHVDRAGLLSDLAAAKLYLGKFDEAETLLRRTIFSLERAYNPHQGLLASSLLNRAELLCIMNRSTEEVAGVVERARLALSLVAKEEEAIDFAGDPIIDSLVSTEVRLERMGKGSAQSALERIQNEEGHGTGRLLGQKSLCLLKMQQFDEAAEVQNCAVEALEQKLGEQSRHVELAFMKNNLALFSESPEDACSLYMDTLERQPRMLEVETNLKAASGGGMAPLGDDDVGARKQRNPAPRFVEAAKVSADLVLNQLSPPNLVCGLSTRICVGTDSSAEEQ
eukprot:g4721.t1